MRYLPLFFLLSPLFLVLQSSAQELEPTEEKALMTVKVVNMDKGPKVDQKVVFTGKNSGKEFSKKTDEDGSFKILLPKGDVYQVSYKVLGEKHQVKKVKLPDQAGKMTGNVKLMFKMPQKITLRNVHFNTGEASLRESSYEALKELKRVLKGKTNLRVMIAGHTDSRGDEASNQELSEARAKAVVDYLVEHGIDPSRLEAKGFGESQPIASNDTPEGRQKNRRTEVRVIER